MIEERGGGEVAKHTYIFGLCVSLCVGCLLEKEITKRLLRVQWFE